jgi:hypothetical protein
VKVLGKVFRGKFVAGLRKAFRTQRLSFSGQIRHLIQPKRFAAFLRTLFRQNWVVYAKPPFGGPKQVLRYLGRYTHRVAISNHRLLAFDGQSVTFRWKDYAHGNKKRKMTLATDEFLRRFLLHTLPRGFVRIRFFGFLAGPRRSQSLQLARRLLEVESQAGTPTQFPERASRPCPLCATPMIVIERLSAAKICRAIGAHRDALNDSS